MVDYELFPPDKKYKPNLLRIENNLEFLKTFSDPQSHLRIEKKCLKISVAPIHEQIALYTSNN